MNSYVSWFLQGLILVPVTLLPIINPLSSAPVFAATVGSNRSMAQRLARQVAVNAWFVLVAATAWHMLHHTEDDDVHAVAAENAATLSDAEIVQRSFFPITFPLTTGPGTIAASIALGAQIPRDPVKYALGVAVAACGAAIVSLALDLIFKNSVAVLARLGKIGTLVMIRMMAFILLCIGIQIMWTGWAELNGGAGVTVSETQSARRGLSQALVSN